MVNDAAAGTAAAAETAGAAGRLVDGRYRLHEPIGRGATGVVWRGRDELLDREVAVKEVRSALSAAEDQNLYQRTIREAKAAAQLNHPSVVTVFDVVEEDGRPWIVMELAAARSLDRLIGEDGPLRPLQAARVGEQLVSALACAHAAGVLHRDVKPANVLLGRDDRAVLTDFGIATRPGDPALTQAGMVVGTPGFTAPERIRGESATPASDLWSLGATLYTAVEGRGPFERTGGFAAVIAGVVGEDPPRAPSAGPLGPVIDALLRADPAQRPDAATTARLLADAAAAAESGSVPGGFHVPGGGPEFADVREFPPLPPPADLPASADLPEFLDQPVPLDLPTVTDAPSFPGPPGSAPAGPPSHPAPTHLPNPVHSPAAGAGQSRPRRRPRVLTAVLTAVAMVVAGLIGYAAYPRPVRTTDDPGPAPAAQAGAVGGGGANGPTSPGATTPGVKGDRDAAAGRTAASGRGSTGSSGSTTSGSTTSGSTASGSTATLPAGYQWFRVTAASSGAVAGFEIAAPVGWQLTTQGLVSYLKAPSGSASIEISLAAFRYLRPWREAVFLQAQAVRQDQYPGYQLVAIRLGTLLGAPDAAWRFSWQPEAATRTGVLELLVTLGTAAGTQGYELAVSAPSAAFPAAQEVFLRALRTFRALT